MRSITKPIDELRRCECGKILSKHNKKKKCFRCQLVDQQQLVANGRARSHNNF